jgi:hypothetical protein
MRRRTFDALLTAGGLVLAAVLLVAGGLLVWGHNFIDTQVHDQLAAQKIFLPPKGDPALDPKEFPDLQQYAGQQVVNGNQAKAFANGFIRRHLEAASGGKTYSELSTESRANPNDQKLAAAVQTTFRGETLRGMLLNAYAFWQMAQVAMYAAMGAFIAAAIMLVLTGLGFWHLRKTPAGVIIGRPTPVLANA